MAIPRSVRFAVYTALVVLGITVAAINAAFMALESNPQWLVVVNSVFQSLTGPAGILAGLLAISNMNPDDPFPTLPRDDSGNALR